MINDTSGTDAGRSRPRPKRIAVRVMIVQTIALLLLWLLQARYGS